MARLISAERLVTFAFIWAGLIVFTPDALYTQRHRYKSVIFCETAPDLAGAVAGG